MRLLIISDTHIPKRARDLPEPVWRAVDDADVVVFGHSHIPWDSVTTTGLRLLNPGSPTDKRRQPDHTYLTATVRSGRLSEVELHTIPPPTEAR
ncbi:metallophosphoesterase family protein [Nocardia sp. bgisy118]|uniref:metallophosphoesterase family protein n=1 Tax=Nocardia sp. bgisy118 TaxID=3413786 RepID=UPI003F49F999